MRKIATLIVGAVVALGVGFAMLMPAPVAALQACPTDTTNFTGICDSGGTKYYYNKGTSLAEDEYKKMCGIGQGLNVIKEPICASGSGQNTNSLFGNGSIINTVINIMLFLIGILCVIMIIYGGIRYTISRGEDKEITSAKNTILYAIVGLIIAIIAYALVNFVFTSIGTSS